MSPNARFLNRERRCTGQGFTLIEVLVVVSVIALLVAILLPALARARKLARDTMCQSNLHSIGQGILLYLHDHKGLFPSIVHDPTHDSRVEPTSSVFQNNQFYLYGDKVLVGGFDRPGIARPVNKYIHAKSGVYRCPFDTENPVAVALIPSLGHYGSTYQANGNSYPYNVGLDDLYYPGPDVGLGLQRMPVLYMKKVESVKDTSRLVLAGDTTSVYPQHFTLKQSQPWYASFFTHDPKKPACNLLFVDGHASGAVMREPKQHIVNSSYSLVLQGTPKAWYGVSGP